MDLIYWTLSDNINERSNRCTSHSSHFWKSACQSLRWIDRHRRSQSFNWQDEVDLSQRKHTKTKAPRMNQLQPVMLAADLTTLRYFVPPPPPMISTGWKILLSPETDLIPTLRFVQFISICQFTISQMTTWLVAYTSY